MDRMLSFQIARCSAGNLRLFDNIPAPFNLMDCWKSAARAAMVPPGAGRYLLRFAANPDI
jgi:hypothetical protein